MFFQEVTPDTTGYMLLGYAVLLGLPLAYVAWFFIRRRNLERDRRLIESLQADDE
jgi:hypothetical protein